MFVRGALSLRRQDKACPEAIELQKRYDLVPICPEVLGGLPTPRVSSEIIEDAQGFRVLNSEGTDNTEAFIAGAARALETIKREGREVAILKAKSPSCGSGLIYDGTFTGSLIPGDGVTTRLFRRHNIRVIDETNISQLNIEQ